MGNAFRYRPFSTDKPYIVPDIIPNEERKTRGKERLVRELDDLLAKETGVDLEVASEQREEPELKATDVFQRNGVEIKTSKDGDPEAFVDDLMPEMVQVGVTACSVIKRLAGQDAACVITDGMRKIEDQPIGKDGRRQRSFHVTGNAIDIRARHLDAEMKERVAAELQNSLGSEYQVIWKPYHGENKTNHIHIERDTKETKGDMNVTFENFAQT